MGFEDEVSRLICTEERVRSVDVGSALEHCVVALQRRGFRSRGLVKTAEHSLDVLLHTQCCQVMQFKFLYIQACFSVFYQKNQY